MFSFTFLSLIFSLFLTISHGASNCPLYGPLFPIPQQLSASSAVQNAISSLTSAINAIDSSYGSNNSYSIQVFSSSEILYEHYHTAPTLPTYNSPGVKQVDANTVYRIGSITKIFTMYAFLLDAGAKYFSQPVTDFVPELAALASRPTGNAISSVAWGDITIGDLASHLAGLSSDGEFTRCLIYSMKPR